MSDTNNKVKYERNIDLDLEIDPELDLDRGFKRCVLEALHVWLIGDEAKADYKKAVANNVVKLLGRIEAEDLKKFQEMVRSQEV
jgi:hypothetical protein